MMRRPGGSTFVVIALTLSQMIACSKQVTENPFNYPFITTLHMKQETGMPHTEYRAFYVLTEDFEPTVESTSDLDGIREVLKFASNLSAQYHIPWTHFIDVNALAPAFISDDLELKQRCRAMIGDLAAMTSASDDCELHMHGPMNPALLDYARSEGKIHLKQSGAEESQPYRQRKSYFFQSFYGQGYRQLVASLTYGKRLLERSVYDGKKQVLAFRPGGWDHGDSEQDTLRYFHALRDSGLMSNSGLSTGHFGGPDWRVGNGPGLNIAKVALGEKTLFEVSPTAGPGGYLNPVLTSDLNKLASSVKNEMAVIVAVYHLGALQQTTRGNQIARSEAELEAERNLLELHFKTVAELADSKILYPITLRDLLAIIAAQQ